MPYKLQPFLFISLCAVMLTACVNLKPVPSQSKSYILGPVDALSQDGIGADKEAIYILRPQIPTYLDSTWLSYRSDNGELNKMIEARWAEPLAEGIARAISLYLSEGGEARVEGHYPWPDASSKSSRLSLNFQRFSATESGEVNVVALWRLRDSEGTVKSGRYSSDQLVWAVGQPDTLVAAYNSALRQIAAEVGATISGK